jgi:hypothetical protein
MVFYQQVISKTGFDKYRSIDVQYQGQVVAAKSIGPKVDSVRFRHNVMQMLKEAREMQEPDHETTIVNDQQGTDHGDNIISAVNTKDAEPQKKASSKVAGVNKKETAKKAGEKQLADKKQPKAIMPKRL